MSAYNAELIWNKAQLGNLEAIHRAVEKGFQTLYSESSRNRAQGEEIVGVERRF